MRIRASIFTVLIVVVIVFAFLSGFSVSSLSQKSSTVLSQINSTKTIIVVTVEQLPSNSPKTITEQIIEQEVVVTKLLVSGNCTIIVPTIGVTTENQTNYILPNNVTKSYFNATVTTETILDTNIEASNLPFSPYTTLTYSVTSNLESTETVITSNSTYTTVVCSELP